MCNEPGDTRMVTVYGIGTCDTCRRALKLLAERGVEHRFHDLRRDGLDRARVDAWADAVGGEGLLNRRGRTWRSLDPAERDGLDDDGLRELLVRAPTLIRRPVAELPDGGITIGLEPLLAVAQSRQR